MYPSLTFAQRVGNLIARQGGTPIEAALLNGQLLSYGPHGTQNKGVNSTFAVGLDGVPQTCFHKTFAGVDAAIAHFYSQSPDTAPINECAAWLLAKALDTPYDTMVPPCVLRELSGEPGSLVLGVDGVPQDQTPFAAGHPQGMAAAFFDALIAQQDRHARNFRWNVARSHLYLIDHGYAFARPGDNINATVFVQTRWARGAQALSASEQGAVGALTASTDLFGLAAILEPPRADRLYDRARGMLGRGEITKPGDF